VEFISLIIKPTRKDSRGSGGWEAGQTAPSIDNAALLARFYNVSLDRLCGLNAPPELDLEGLDREQIEALQAVVGAFKK